MDEQRKRVYGYRQRILDGGNCRDLILDMIDEQIDEQPADVPRPELRRRVVRRRRRQPAARRSSKPATSATPTSPTPSGSPHDEASRQAESQVFDAIEENLPERRRRERVELGSAGQAGQHPLGPEPPRSRPEEDRPRPARRVADRARPARRSTRSICRRCARYLEPDYGVKTACGWVQRQVRRRARRRRRSRELEPARVHRSSRTSGRSQAYDEREAEYPGAGRPVPLHRPRRGGQKQGFDREELVEWARGRFGVELDRRRPQEQAARRNPRGAGRAQPREQRSRPTQIAAEAQQRVDAAVRRRRRRRRRSARRPATTASSTISPAGSTRRCECEAAARRAGEARPRSGPAPRGADRRGPLPPRDAADGADAAACRFSTRPGKSTCWRWTTCAPASACAAMPRSIRRSSTSAKACGCSTRCGSRVGDYVTDLIFKMEQLDEDFVGSTWVEGAAIKEDAPAGERDRPSSSRRRSTAPRPTRRSSRSATAARRSAATTRAPAAAARSTRTAACGVAQS